MPTICRQERLSLTSCLPSEVGAVDLSFNFSDQSFVVKRLCEKIIRTQIEYLIPALVSRSCNGQNPGSLKGWEIFYKF